MCGSGAASRSCTRATPPPATAFSFRPAHPGSSPALRTTRTCSRARPARRSRGDLGAADPAGFRGIETPTRAELARFDRSRKDRKTSNKEWQSPQDTDAKIAKMKDGRTHLAHKAEHGIDLETGAILSVTVQEASEGDSGDAAGDADDGG